MGTSVERRPPGRPPRKGWSSPDDPGLVQASQFNLSALGFLELSLDNPKVTHELLWPLAEGVLAAGIREPGVLRFLPDEIEALIAIGETETARSILEPFAARAERSTDRGRWRPPNEAGVCSTLRSASFPKRSPRSNAPSSTTRCSMSPSSSVERSSRRAKPSAA